MKDSMYIFTVEMPTCKECRFYKPVDDSKGDCFGHEAPANMDAEKCLKKAFQPKSG